MGSSLAFHLSVCRARRRPAADDADRRGHAPSHWRPRMARARAPLVQGVRGPVRRRRRVGHDHQLRAGAAVPALHVFRRRDHRPAVLAGGLRLLHRGDLPRHLPVRLGPHVAATALAGRLPAGAVRRRLRVLHRHRQRLDERPTRVSTAPRPRHARRSAGRDVQPRLGYRDEPHGHRCLPGDRVRGGVGVRGRDAARPAGRLSPPCAHRRVGHGGGHRPPAARRRRPARPHRGPQPAGEAGRDRRSVPQRARRGPQPRQLPDPGARPLGAQRQGAQAAQHRGLRRRQREGPRAVVVPS